MTGSAALNLRCYVCGESIDSKFQLTSEREETDRPFVIHPKCKGRLHLDVFATAVLASQESTPRCPHCGGTKDGPMPLSGAGSRFFYKWHQESTPGTQPPSIRLVEPEEMISWLTDLNSNWAVCRNTQAFKEGQPAEYWKKFDKAMGKAFELQVALMKLHNAPAVAHPPSEGRLRELIERWQLEGNDETNLAARSRRHAHELKAALEAQP